MHVFSQRAGEEEASGMLSSHHEPPLVHLSMADITLLPVCRWRTCAAAARRPAPRSHLRCSSPRCPRRLPSALPPASTPRPSSSPLRPHPFPLAQCCPRLVAAPARRRGWTSRWLVLPSGLAGAAVQRLHLAAALGTLKVTTGLCTKVKGLKGRAARGTLKVTTGLCTKARGLQSKLAWQSQGLLQTVLVVVVVMVVVVVVRCPGKLGSLDGTWLMT